jgi:hypothetical protein
MKKECKKIQIALLAGEKIPHSHLQSCKECQDFSQALSLIKETCKKLQGTKMLEKELSQEVIRIPQDIPARSRHLKIKRYLAFAFCILVVIIVGTKKLFISETPSYWSKSRGISLLISEMDKYTTWVEDFRTYEDINVYQGLSPIEEGFLLKEVFNINQAEVDSARREE